MSNEVQNENQTPEQFTAFLHLDLDQEGATLKMEGSTMEIVKALAGIMTENESVKMILGTAMMFCEMQNVDLNELNTPNDQLTEVTGPLDEIAMSQA
jgi:xylose isomerase